MFKLAFNIHRGLMEVATVCVLIIGCGKPPVTPLANPKPEPRTQNMADGSASNTAASGCGNTHPMVGARAALSTRQHGVRGTVTIVSDCSFRIDNFFYDGGGPNVRVYGAVASNFRTGFNTSDNLAGRSYLNESLTLYLPVGKTLNDMNSVSIWCSDFNVNFGSATFQ